MKENNLGFDTLALHAGWDGDPTTRARAVPIYQTAAYDFEDTEQAANLFSLKSPDFPGQIYSRFTNPTCDVLERKMAALEGGIAAASLSSGQSATTLSVLNIADKGENLVAAKTLYGGTYTAFDHVFSRKFGIETRFVDSSPESFASAIDERTKAIFAETIGNPALNVLDISEVAKVAHEAGVPLIVDNTFPTPRLCRPIEHGADVVVHSATKWIGHGTSLGGIVIDSGDFNWSKGKFPQISEDDPAYGGLNYLGEFGRLAYIVKLKSRMIRDLGSCMSPFNAFLFVQGLETLSLRMDRHSQNALAVAEFLMEHNKVRTVVYPGLREHPSHELALKYFSNGYGGVVGFNVEGGSDAGKRFIESLRLFRNVANVGETRSLAIHPATTTHSQLTSEQQIAAGVSPGFVRLSIGIENVEDLLEDLDRALARAF